MSAAASGGVLFPARFGCFSGSRLLVSSLLVGYGSWFHLFRVFWCFTLVCGWVVICAGLGAFRCFEWLMLELTAFWFWLGDFFRVGLV